MNYLLDTCVISELVARQPDARVVQWVDNIEESVLFLSVITIGEIRKGISRLPDSRRRAELEDWLNQQLLTRFDTRVVPIDIGVALAWGELTGALALAGKTMPAIDSLIAASARYGQFCLVTSNEQDFQYAGIPILNPWNQPA
jgi:predicted nucleic acid-binding protein